MAICRVGAGMVLSGQTYLSTVAQAFKFLVSAPGEFADFSEMVMRTTMELGLHGEAGEMMYLAVPMDRCGLSFTRTKTGILAFYIFTGIIFILLLLTPIPNDQATTQFSGSCQGPFRQNAGRAIKKQALRRNDNARDGTESGAAQG